MPSWSLPFYYAKNDWNKVGLTPPCAITTSGRSLDKPKTWSKAKLTE